MKRKIDVVILSDVHLGTYGSSAEELLQYLKSIDVNTLVLNGDIIDMWAFSKSYFPPSHVEVIREIMKKMQKGAVVYYLTGNHDDTLRRFTDFTSPNFYLLDKLILTIGGKSVWIFHGDVFDASVQHAKWIAKLGGKGYDLLIRFNRFINLILVKFGRQKRSFSKRIKQKVKRAAKNIGDFEKTAADLAINNGYDYVVCGHIHRPTVKLVSNTKGEVLYMNSGDWVENQTALEYYNDQWHFYNHAAFKSSTPIQKGTSKELLEIVTDL